MRQFYEKLLELGGQKDRSYTLLRTWDREKMHWQIVCAEEDDSLCDEGSLPIGRDMRTKFREEISLAESVCRTDRIVVCGGGHVSIPIIKLAKSVGFFVTVLEDRPMFADNARRAGADEVICMPFDAGLKQVDSDLSTWFVIVTRGHRYDSLCLEQILNKNYAYVGLMGSRRRTRMVKDQMEEKGFSREKLDGIFTPIGLPIGAQTPEEIAVSVMAEVIGLRAKKRQQANIGREFLEKLVSAPCVLTEIIERRGSAPRGVGAKMLVFEDGTTYDTIGGGCAESDVIAKALLMLRGMSEPVQLVTVDMTAEQAEEEGMVCGGTIQVYMELIRV